MSDTSYASAASDPGNNTGVPSWQQGTSGSTDVVTALQGITRLLSAMVGVFQGKFTTGTTTLAASATTVVSQPAVKSGATIILAPLNAAAATLVGSSKSPYVSAISAGTSFTISTADGTNPTGTEAFSYYIINP